MEWFQYLLEANLYLTLGFVCFYFTLRKKTFYIFNRWYLIVITVLSFLLPLCSINLHSNDIQQKAIPFEANFKTRSAVDHFRTSQTNIEQVANPLTWMDTFQFVYLAIVTGLFLKTVFGVLKIIKLYYQSPRFKENNIVHVFLREERKIFSFFGWLFYHPSLKNNEAIMAHELVHIKQRHSLDLLFFDVLIGLNWFNPVVYLLFKTVKINHEFIADGKATQKTGNKYEYAKLLINFVSPSTYRLGHSISSSSQLEKRISQLGSKQSAKYMILPSIVIFPCMFASVLVFSAFASSNNSYKVFAYRHFSSTNNEMPASKIDLPRHTKIDLSHQSNALNAVHEKNATKKGMAIVARNNKPKKRMSALDVLYDWTVNTAGKEIRHFKHSVFMGNEAQLFRGETADTLYADLQNFKISGNEVEVTVDQLMVNSLPINPNEKKLVVVDARKRKVIAVLPKVAIKTKGMIHEVRLVAEDGEKPKRNLLAYNMRIQYAVVNAAKILTEEEDKNQPYQPGILW